MNNISEYGEPNMDDISLSPFARKNLIQSGFIAGAAFCGVSMRDLRDSDNPEDKAKFEAFKKALLLRFEMHGLTREIEF